MSDRLFETPDRDAAGHLEELGEAEAELESVEMALRRLDDGSYGTCEVCGVALPDLDVDPAARRCAAHQAIV